MRVLKKKSTFLCTGEFTDIKTSLMNLTSDPEKESQVREGHHYSQISLQNRPLYGLAIISTLIHNVLSCDCIR